MLTGTTSTAVQSSNAPTPRLRNVVEAYMASRRFPTHAHPSFPAITDALRSSWIGEPSQAKPVTVGPLAVQKTPSQAIAATLDEDDVPIEDWYKDADLYKDNFKQALILYEKTAPEKAKTHIKVLSTHTWDDVLNLVDGALASYQDTSGPCGKIKKMLRKLGSQTEMLMAWSSLLPSQSEYFSLLCGGLKIIITAAARLRHICDELTTALEELPSLLSCVHGTLTAFRRSRDLQKCSADLYISLIASMDSMVGYLTKSSVKRFLGAAFKVDGFGKEIEQRIDAVRSRSKAFENCAKLCSYTLQAASHDNLNIIKREGRQAQLDNARNFDQIGRQQHEQSSAIYHEVRFGGDRLLLSQQQTKQEIKQEMQLQLQDFKDQVVTTLTSFLASNRRVDSKTCTLRAEAPSLRRRASDSDQLRKRSRLVKQRLLQTLEFDDTIVSSDLGASLRQDYNYRLRSEDRVVAIAEDPRFGTWLSSANSTVLFINGNHTASQHQPPTSFVSARLVTTIRNGQQEQQATAGRSYRPRILTMSHFCAQHKHPKDADAGPGGMLRSLLAQLLTAWPDFDLTAVERLRNIDYDNVDNLEHIFELLIAQIPPGVVVFCILDAVTVLEDRKVWKEDAARVIGALVRLVEIDDVESHCVLKLLMTSPTESRVLHRQVPKQSVIWMPENVPRSGPMSDHSWKQGVAQRLQSSSSDPLRLVTLDDAEDATDSDQ